MSNPIETLLARKGRIVLDGALATELERRGADLNDPLWSARVLLETPELIRAVHLDYFRAGADLATTASYQATVPGFAQRGLSRAGALALIRSSVVLAAAAREEYLAGLQPEDQRPLLIAGSVGPYGAYMADGSEYRGDYDLTEAELAEFHLPRLAALLEAGADLLALETIPSLLEAQALVGLLAEFPSVFAWVSFSARDGQHTCHGERLEDCAAYLDGFPQVAAIGINCTAPRFIPELIGEIRRASAKPVVVYPNSGEIYDAATNTWHGESSCEAFGEQAAGWLAAGARLIGGCCRTSPEHIAEISKNY